MKKNTTPSHKAQVGILLLTMMDRRKERYKTKQKNHNIKHNRCTYCRDYFYCCILYRRCQCTSSVRVYRSFYDFFFFRVLIRHLRYAARKSMPTSSFRPTVSSRTIASRIVRVYTVS